MNDSCPRCYDGCYDAHCEVRENLGRRVTTKDTARLPFEARFRTGTINDFRTVERWDGKRMAKVTQFYVAFEPSSVKYPRTQNTIKGLWLATGLFN